MRTLCDSTASSSILEYSTVYCDQCDGARGGEAGRGLGGQGEWRRAQGRVGSMIMTLTTPIVITLAGL